MQFELARTADVDLIVLMKDGKDGSKHRYRRVSLRLVAHLFRGLWLVLHLLSDAHL